MLVAFAGVWSYKAKSLLKHTSKAQCKRFFGSFRLAGDKMDTECHNQIVVCQLCVCQLCQLSFSSPSKESDCHRDHNYLPR